MTTNLKTGERFPDFELPAGLFHCRRGNIRWS
jgi:hypothetical protein